MADIERQGGAGRGPHGARTAPVEVRIVRAVCMAGKRIEVGDYLTLPPGTAAELIAAGKAERGTRTAAVPPVPSPDIKPAAVKTAAGAQKELPHAQ